MLLFAIFIALVFFYSLVSGRLERTIVTAPIVFTVAGMLVLFILPEVRDRRGDLEVLLRLAELGLVLLLFTDASRIDLGILRHIQDLAVRLLSVGLLLGILLGTLFALVIFHQLTVWEAAIIGAILAPTDAGLGQIIMHSPRVPLRIRKALNVEAGLNDGLCVPFLLFFISMAGAAATGQNAALVRFIMEQLGFGALIGIAIGLMGGILLGRARRREWMKESSQELGVVALPLLCMLAADAVRGSMFIAAFVAGLALQVGFKESGRHSGEFTAKLGKLLNLSVFFLFGLIVARDWQHFTLSSALYAVLSLTIVRMLSVALALIGTRLSRATVLFMGWFGPRGLASIVLGLVYLEQSSPVPDASTIRVAVMMTILLSIFAHGLSAAPGINLYAKRIGGLGSDAAEHQGARSKFAGVDASSAG